MAKPPPKRWPKRNEAKRRDSKRDEPAKPPSRFAPAAFLSGNPEAVQRLCEDLATQAAARFSDLTGTSWSAMGRALVEQLRASGHDLSSFDESENHQEWQATWHHPRGTFSLFLAFRAPASVEVTWRTDDGAFTAKA